jgi:signal transduction histidine kinase
MDEAQLEKRINILKEIEVFRDTPEDILREIAEILTEHTIKKQEIIFRKGDEGHSMYIIVSGTVRVHVGDHVLTRLGKGRVFGEYALFDRESRSASITAEEETHLFELEQSDFTKLMAPNIHMVKGVVKHVVRRIREMNELERKLAHSYIKIQKQNEEIERQNHSIIEQKMELEKANEQLQQLNEEKRHLINVLAQDLRNPLTSSLCLSDLFRSQNSNLTMDQIKSIEVIHNSIHRMNRIINQVLDINEIDSKSISLKPEIFNLAVLIEEIRETYTYAVAQKNIRLHLETSDLYVNLDRNYTSLIIENILSNAIKFSPHDKNIYLKLVHKDDRAIIEIMDEGPGIGEQDIKKLFGKYQKQAYHGEDIPETDGMGLSIVMKYVEAMRGKIWCDSKPGRGATIGVEFKMYQSNNEQ